MKSMFWACPETRKQQRGIFSSLNELVGSWAALVVEVEAFGRVSRMKGLLLLPLLAAAALGAADAADLQREEWVAFKLEHRKAYASSAEERARMAVFARNRLAVARHNQRHALRLEPFRLALNRFADLTADEFARALNGFRPPKRRLLDSAGAEPWRCQFPGLPARVDWRSAGAVTAVKQQGQCASCWAFAAVSNCVHLRRLLDSAAAEPWRCQFPGLPARVDWRSAGAVTAVKQQGQRRLLDSAAAEPWRCQFPGLPARVDWRSAGAVTAVKQQGQRRLLDSAAAEPWRCQFPGLPARVDWRSAGAVTAVKQQGQRRLLDSAAAEPWRCQFPGLPARVDWRSAGAVTAVKQQGQRRLLDSAAAEPWRCQFPGLPARVDWRSAGAVTAVKQQGQRRLLDSAAAEPWRCQFPGLPARVDWRSAGAVTAVKQQGQRRLLDSAAAEPWRCQFPGLPARVDWRSAGAVTAVKQQGQRRLLDSAAAEPWRCQFPGLPARVDWRSAGAVTAVKQQGQRRLLDSAAAEPWRCQFPGLPARVDWRSAGAVTAVKQQGQCASCWAFAAVIIVFTCRRRLLDSAAAEPWRCQFPGLPARVDWRSAGAVTAVKQQGQCASCWAFAATGAIEGQRFRDKRVLESLSEQNLLDCANSSYGCAGGTVDAAFSYVRARGIESEAAYPYEAQQEQCRYDRRKNAIPPGYVTKFRPCPPDEECLKLMVAKAGPAAAAVDASRRSFQLYESGVYYDDACSPDNVTHAVLVVGYGTDEALGDYWLVKNSYGAGWGERGYVRMARGRCNNCGIAADLNAGGGGGGLRGAGARNAPRAGAAAGKRLQQGHASLTWTNTIQLLTTVPNSCAG
ncbi:uncharacterized protein LOC123870505 [Maniola jurtina]|uniref:uncharacterized protein LOC123870505 n=1 Tax=Maniola jurtina TaxID=191418 RepID=UPI001E68C988|nr:uncharacterized protein LOC123870505 [Maniola jurtina]